MLLGNRIKTLLVQKEKLIQDLKFIRKNNEINQVVLRKQKGLVLNCSSNNKEKREKNEQMHTS